MNQKVKNIDELEEEVAQWEQKFDKEHISKKGLATRMEGQQKNHHEKVNNLNSHIDGMNETLETERERYEKLQDELKRETAMVNYLRDENLKL